MTNNPKKNKEARRKRFPDFVPIYKEDNRKERRKMNSFIKHAEQNSKRQKEIDDKIKKRFDKVRKMEEILNKVREKTRLRKEAKKEVEKNENK